ncbi:hypothetical protein I5449_01555 [Citrobacter sp. FDAARGOS_156]|uniref:hypothetical protein n=1 Tax=Citrobacter sp. FDAARGOS_156 TaxID=1702170 RepID=UPI0018FF5B4F|nr:hypothetical protein [Citrobacter sp. FDAARGOS_156]MBJ9110074.1 hypothetical protein [Citrobacter sp. FDAARGOS_156]
MTKITREFTKEQLIAKAREQIAFCCNTKITGEGRAHVNQCSSLFEIALASLEAEAVVPPTVTVKLPESFHPDGDIDAPLVVELDDVKAMLAAAGIGVKGE